MGREEEVMSERHVRPNGHSGWVVTDPQGAHINSRHSTDAQARLWARAMVRGAGGGIVRIHDRSGNLAAEERVSPASSLARRGST